MKKVLVIASMVILIVSLVILFSRLFAPQPIQITLETGKEITTENAAYFTFAEALILVVSAFLTGATSIFLYYNAELERLPLPLKKDTLESDYRQVLGLLKSDEQRALREIIKSNGDLVQSALVGKLGLSKVKVTRILARLEKKDLIQRHRQGFTNKILLKR